MVISSSHVHTQWTLPANDVSADLPLIEVTAEPTFIGQLLVVLVLTVFVIPMFHLPWWLAVAPAGAFAVYRSVAELLCNRLLEPVVKITRSPIWPGDEVALECELRAKTVATVQQVVVGLKSEESYGEASHTEKYDEWTLAFPCGPIGGAPVAARHTFQVPRDVPRRWSKSELTWYVTLRVEVEDGMTVERSYRICRC